MYHVTSVQIGQTHPLFDYCDRVTHAANNVFNATMFVERQCFFGLKKDPDKRFDLEKEVIESVAASLDQMNAPKLKKDGTPKNTGKKKAKEGSKEEKSDQPKKPQFQMPTASKPVLKAEFLQSYFQVSENPDYLDERLGRQTAQNTVKEVAQQFWNFFKSLKEYRKDPSKYTGEPKIPGYLEKGGMHTAYLSNIECELRSGVTLTESNGKEKHASHYCTDPKKTPVFIEGHQYLKLPLTNLVCDMGPVNVTKMRLMEVQITPHHGIFTISLVLDTEMGKKTFESRMAARDQRKAEKEQPVPPLPEGVPLRAVSLDLGVNNLIAMTNNVGAECLLFKGLVVKSINQYYNKNAATMVSEQTKGTTNKFVPTPEFHALTTRRNNRIKDVMHKTAKYVIEWCVAHKINTIVVGKNALWKQKADMGPKNNQNFVQIPFATLIDMLSYLAKRHDIRFIEQEESYTSQASFLDRDPIPVYGETNGVKPQFSGHRAPTTYHGHRKVQPIDKKTGQRKTTNPGFHGLYKSKDGTIINADLNGSANIGRKAIPDMYDPGVGIAPDFNNVRVIRIPEEVHVRQNQMQQHAKFVAKARCIWIDDKGQSHPCSRLARKRRQRKAARCAAAMATSTKVTPVE